MYWLVFVLLLPFDLIKAVATQTETWLLKQYVAGECVDLLDDVENDFRCSLAPVLCQLQKTGRRIDVCLFFRCLALKF